MDNYILKGVILPCFNTSGPTVHNRLDVVSLMLPPIPTGIPFIACLPISDCGCSIEVPCPLYLDYPLIVNMDDMLEGNLGANDDGWRVVRPNLPSPCTTQMF